MNKIAYAERLAVYDEAEKKWGLDAQLMMAVEEMSELTKEICKMHRGKQDFEALADEIADVSIMMEQLKHFFALEDMVSEHMDAKIRRLQSRLDADKEEL